VAFNHLAVVIVDEQHKFGVLQRHQFRTKGPMPHYLVMTATPIPRTLAMTVFGDLDVSLIKQPPPGRGRIITKVVTGKQWSTVMSYVRQRLERGEQAYVVCPQIGKEGTQAWSHEATEEIGAPNGSEGPSAARLTAVTEAFRRLYDGPWHGLNVGLLHGSLRPAEKKATIDAFAAGRLHAVVATTVVEVGVDVPNATIMIVEHAERYGLSQLHQLRGRVGRGSRESLCVLIARGRGEKAAERLDVMVRTTDGFQIAETDLRQRGPGQLFGTRQHGLPELHVASIVDDFALLEKARQDAFDIVAKDPTLTQPDHQPLLPALRKMFGEKLALIDAA
jgi:ATP-dependent DNA helicase RecG